MLYIRDIRLYPIISHHIPPYPTIPHHHIPPYQNRDIPKIYARGGLAKARDSPSQSCLANDLPSQIVLSPRINDPI